MRRKTYRTKYEEARQAAADKIVRLAATWVKEAKYAPPLLAEQTEEILGLYQEIFPETDQAYVMQVAYADFLYKNRRKYELAAKEHEKIIETDLARPEKHPRGRYLCWATYGVVLARQNLLLTKTIQADLDFIEAGPPCPIVSPKNHPSDRDQAVGF